jgi:hypothetical protein
LDFFLDEFNAITAAVQSVFFHTDSSLIPRPVVVVVDVDIVVVVDADVVVVG